jgi:hypothetical protein
MLRCDIATLSLTWPLGIDWPVCIVPAWCVAACACEAACVWWSGDLATLSHVMPGRQGSLWLTYVWLLVVDGVRGVAV